MKNMKKAKGVPSKPRAKLGTIELEILEEISAADVFIGFLCSGRSTTRMFKIARDRARYRYRRRLAVERLINEGFIKARGERAFITQSGLSGLNATLHKTRALLKNKTWDSKWRIVTYDIPIQQNVLRDAVRRILKKAGFVKLHQSIWVFPHECEELSRLLQEKPGLSDCVLYGTLEKLGNDELLRKHFDL